MISHQYVATNGDMEGLDSFRYCIPLGVGKNRSICYQELLSVVEHYKKRQEIPPLNKFRQMMPSSCRQYPACRKIVERVVLKIMGHDSLEAQ